MLNNKDLIPPGEQCTLTTDEFLNYLGLSWEQYLRIIRSQLTSTTVFLRREPNSIRINAYNPLLLYLWRSNMDIQFVLNAYAVAKYICSYIAKGQKSLALALKKADEEAKKKALDLYEHLKNIARSFIRHEEFGAQEAAILTLGIPITMSSRHTVFINTGERGKHVHLMKSLTELAKLPDSSTEIFSTDMITRYETRPILLDKLTLAQFAAGFVRKGWETQYEELTNKMFAWPDKSVFIKLQTNRIIRYVRFSITKDPENHFRELLMLFKPFRTEDEIISPFKSYKEKYQSVLSEVEPIRAMFEFHRGDVERAQFELQEMTQTELQAIHDNIQPQPDNCGDSIPVTNFPVDDPTDSTDVALIVPQMGNLLDDDAYFEMIASLNSEQSDLFYPVVKDLRTKCENKNLFVTGGAGVGKTHVLNVLYQAFHRHFQEDDLPLDNPTVILSAQAALAATHIFGTTIHKCLGFHRASDNPFILTPISRDRLSSLQAKYANLQCMFIDEVSLVSADFVLLIAVYEKSRTQLNRLEAFG